MLQKFQSWLFNRTQRKKANEKRLEAQKEYAKNRAEVARMIEDANIALMEDGEAKEIATIKLKYERLIKETNSNIKYLDDEKKIIVKQLADQQAQELDKIEADKKAKEDARIQEAKVKEQETYNDFLARYEAQQTAIEDAQLTAEEREVNAVRDKYFTLLTEAQKYGQDRHLEFRSLGQLPRYQRCHHQLLR